MDEPPRRRARRALEGASLSLVQPWHGPSESHHVSRMAAQPHVLDARGLAVLRMWLALFILRDLLERYGAGDLASLSWYTSLPEERSVLDPQDTPHPHPVHLHFWFYRGGENFQRLLFASAAATACAYLVGFCCDELGSTSVALYLQVTALHGRCEAVNDGADRFLRTLLVWMMVLPTSQCWSIDAARRRAASGSPPRPPAALLPNGPQLSSARRRNPLEPSVDTRVAGVAALGLTVQLVLMYWGTVAFRWRGTSWWPSGGLSAVHTILCAGACRKFADHACERRLRHR